MSLQPSIFTVRRIEVTKKNGSVQIAEKHGGVQVKTLEQQQAEQEAARREEEEASERLRWQLMQVWLHIAYPLLSSHPCQCEGSTLSDLAVLHMLMHQGAPHTKSGVFSQK